MSQITMHKVDVDDTIMQGQSREKEPSIEVPQQLQPEKNENLIKVAKQPYDGNINVLD